MMKRIGITKIGFYLLLLFILTGNGGLNFMANAETVSQVLVVADPGYSGFSLKIAQNIADQLIRKNLSVKLVKVNQFRVQDLAGVQLIVIGGPTYIASRPVDLKSSYPD